MVGALGLDPHLFQHEADLPADRFPLVIRRDIHIARPVIGDLCSISIFIDPKQVELHLSAKCKLATQGAGICHRFFQNIPGIPLKGPAVRIGNIAEHPDRLALLRPPGELDQGRGVRVKQKVGADLAAETSHGPGSKGDPVCEGAFELAGHDGHIVLLSIDVAKGQPNKLDVLLLNELYHFFRRILHVLTRFLSFQTKVFQLKPRLFCRDRPVKNGGQSKENGR